MSGVIIGSLQKAQKSDLSDNFLIFDVETAFKVVQWFKHLLKLIQILYLLKVYRNTLELTCTVSQDWRYKFLGHVLHFIFYVLR